MCCTKLSVVFGFLKGLLFTKILNVQFINKSIVVYRQNHAITSYTLTYLIFVFVSARQPPVSKGLHIHEVSLYPQRRTRVGRTPLDK